MCAIQATRLEEVGNTTLLTEFFKAHFNSYSYNSVILPEPEHETCIGARLIGFVLESSRNPRCIVPRADACVL